MVKLIILLIALCFLLLLGYTWDLGKEVSDLKEEVGLLREQVTGLQGYVDVTDNKCDRIKAEIVDMVKPFTKIIPVRQGWWLGVREESP